MDWENIKKEFDEFSDEEFEALKNLSEEDFKNLLASMFYVYIGTQDFGDMIPIAIYNMKDAKKAVNDFLNGSVMKKFCKRAYKEVFPHPTRIKFGLYSRNASSGEEALVGFAEYWKNDNFNLRYPIIEPHLITDNEKK